jgi:hypothetical protein
MDINQQQINKDKLTNDMGSRISFLQQQIDNLTGEYTLNVKKLQDEIDILTLQSLALTNFDVTIQSATLETALSSNQKMI